MLGGGKFDELLGRGAAGEIYTNWDAARQFVQDQIQNTPDDRLNANQKSNLLIVEQEAFDQYYTFFTAGFADVPYVPQVLQIGLDDVVLDTVEEDIYEYYKYFLEYAQLFTGDQRFLNVFRAAVDASLAVTTDVSKVSDLLPDKKQSAALIIGGVLLAFLILRD